MLWNFSHRFDARALPLADRHYNRRKIGSPQFVPPGRCLVFLTPKADALWVTSWPKAEYTRHAWPGAWICSCFRNESTILSSDLIREAVALTRGIYGDPPAIGMVTFVNPSKVRPKPEKGLGRCFKMAGFVHCGWTAGGLYVLQLAPDSMPEAILSGQILLPIF